MHPHLKAAILAAVVALASVTFAQAAEPAKPGQPTVQPPPQLSQAFAISYSVRAIDQHAETYPYNLRVACERKSRISFHCPARWSDPRGLKWSAKVRVWLQRNSEGTTAWHYRVHALGRDRAGKVQDRLVIL